MALQLPPNPKSFRDMKQWSAQLYEFLLSQTRVKETNNPLPVLLPHRTKGAMERATTAGIVLYDPMLKQMVMSIDGKWVGINPKSVTATELADVASDVNTKGKVTGALVYDSTNATLAVANGPAAADTWSRLTVAATVTPT